MQKMKVVWLCSFANEKLANSLKNNSSLFVSPWISDLIELFKNRNEIEFYIVSPNYYSNKNVNLKLNNFKVFLFKYRYFFQPHKLYNLSYNYYLSLYNIKRIIKTINPDIIHLHGSENPLYSVGVFPFLNKYPILLTIQGFIALSTPPKNILSRYIRWNRIRIEKKINSQVKYITAATEDVESVLNRQNIRAKIFPFYYPTTKPNISTDDNKEKKYDIVYLARITKNKGIEDLIEAIRIITKSYPSFKSLVIGGGNSLYINTLKEKINRYELNNNIIFAGFQQTQQDAFKLAVQAKMMVLPTYFDGLPGSIREAMFMKLPVVAYAVGGIPALNKDEECITLVERQNINQLVEKILLVLNNEKRTKQLVENAYQLITQKYDNSKIYDNLLSIYRDVLIEEKTVKTI